MIQRIQSIYLGLGAVALAGMLYAGMLLESSPLTQWGTLSLALLAIVAAVGAIFMYRVRQKQRKIVVLAQVLTVFTAAFLYGTLYLDGEFYVRTSAGLEWSRLLLLMLPLCAYVLFLLARRAITGDIELVRSMDRLR